MPSSEGYQLTFDPVHRHYLTVNGELTIWPEEYKTDAYECIYRLLYSFSRNHSDSAALRMAVHSKSFVAVYLEFARQNRNPITEESLKKLEEMMSRPLTRREFGWHCVRLDNLEERLRDLPVRPSGDYRRFGGLPYGHNERMRREAPRYCRHGKR